MEMGTGLWFSVLVAVGGGLVTTFAATVFPQQFHAYAFYAGLVLLALGLAGSIMNLPVAQTTQVGAWPKILTIVFAISCIMSAGWWIASPTVISRAHISFQKFALFWVDMGNETYQIGSGIKIFNFETRPQQIDEITVELENWTLVPRGRAWIRRMLQFEDRAELLEDNYIRAGEAAFFKRLLPIKFDIELEHGALPEIILRGRWNLALNGGPERINPPLYSFFDRPISQAEWDDLLKSQSAISIDDLHYKEIPERPDFNAPDRSFLIFHQDQTATIENPYFAQTPPVRGNDGVMLFVRGKLNVPTDKGWRILGHTYHEVWSDPEKLALYNSLYPPGADGRPRPFGFFAGAENEMAGPVDRELAAPTTRAADILDFEINGPR